MIIIDLFNLLYYKYDEINLKILNCFLSKIVFYSNDTKKRIFLIFDGIYFQNNFNSCYSKVELFFINGKADNYIIQLVQTAPSKTYFVVTADREIINIVNSKNKNRILNPKDFWNELYSNNLDNNKEKIIKKTIIKKYKNNNLDIDNEIDLLMIKYSKKTFIKED